MKTFLQPSKSESAKSFYKKAYVERFGDTDLLTSYNTEVASYNIAKDQMIVNGYYSQTTARHINSFLEKWNYPRMSKKEIEDQEGKAIEKK